MISLQGKENNSFWITSDGHMIPFPSKIICIGLNYMDHASEFGLSIPQEPVIFIKPNTTVIGHGDSIVIPRGSTSLGFECELGIVVSKTCRQVPVERAKEYILGYTCVNDVTERDYQAIDGQWTRSKSFDTFCPIGPVVAKIDDPETLELKSILNGNVMQHSNTSEMIHKPYELLSFVSNVMTLFPGDIISTGTPEGVGMITAGDKIEIWIDKIGTLTNTVKYAESEE